MMDLLKDYSVLLNFALMWLIVPVIKQIRASNIRNDAVLGKLNEISNLNHEIVRMHHRTDQIEEAILFLTDNKDIKTVVKIIRGGANNSANNSDSRKGE